MFKRRGSVKRTVSDTVIVNGIEYNQFPSLSSVIKAMEQHWACKLRDEGVIRLNSINYYHDLESPELGDSNEGKGQWYLDGEQMDRGSSNEVFIWCAACPDTSHETLKGLEKNYDSIVTINNIEEFVHRISSSLRSRELKLHPHIGTITYDRGTSVTKEELNSKKWHCNVFQKNPLYAHQNELRLVYTNVSMERINQEYIDISIGECSDIVHVQT
jgi:hypothetical protein